MQTHYDTIPSPFKNADRANSMIAPSLRDEPIFALAWPVERIDFSKLPCVVEPGEGETRPGRARF